jgi:hypothetical protein
VNARALTSAVSIPAMRPIVSGCGVHRYASESESESAAGGQRVEQVNWHQSQAELAARELG